MILWQFLETPLMQETLAVQPKTKARYFQNQLCKSMKNQSTLIEQSLNSILKNHDK